MASEGDAVQEGDRLAAVHAKTQGEADAVAESLRGLVEIADTAVPAPTVLHTV